MILHIQRWKGCDLIEGKGETNEREEVLRGGHASTKRCCGDENVSFLHPILHFVQLPAFLMVASAEWIHCSIHEPQSG